MNKIEITTETILYPMPCSTSCDREQEPNIWLSRGFTMVNPKPP